MTAPFPDNELRNVINSARFELPGYDLYNIKTADPNLHSYVLLSPEKDIAAGLYINTGEKPWIVAEAPFSPERSLRECVYADPLQTAGFFRDPEDPSSEICFEDNNLLSQIWHNLSSTLQYMARPGIEPNPRLVRCVLCVIADAYPKIADLEYAAPMAEGARERLLARILPSRNNDA